MDIDAEKDRIQAFVEGGNFHAAFNIGLSALNESRRNNDQGGVDQFLGILRGIYLSLAHEFGSKEYLKDQMPGIGKPISR